MRFFSVLIIFALLAIGCFSQQSLRDYTGGWAGEISSLNEFQVDFVLTFQTEHTVVLTVTGRQFQSKIDLRADKNDLWSGMIHQHFTYDTYYFSQAISTTNRSRCFGYQPHDTFDRKFLQFSGEQPQTGVSLL